MLSQQIEQRRTRINLFLMHKAIDAQRDRQMRTYFHVLIIHDLICFTVIVQLVRAAASSDAVRFLSGRPAPQIVK